MFVVFKKFVLHDFLAYLRDKTRATHDEHVEFFEVFLHVIRDSQRDGLADSMVNLYIVNEVTLFVRGDARFTIYFNAILSLRRGRRRSLFGDIIAVAVVRFPVEEHACFLQVRRGIEELLDKR